MATNVNDQPDRSSVSDEPRRVRSMHEDVTECDDPICCCEPEPRWQELEEELAQRRSGESRDQVDPRSE